MEVSKRETENCTFVHLSGFVDETSHFETVVGATKRELEVNCKGIARINSIGVRKWIKYFDGLRTSKVKIRFVECSAPLILQAGLFQNFIEPAEIESLFVPLFCEKCKSSVQKLYRVEELKLCEFNPTGSKCSCGGGLIFDDTPEFFQPLMD